MDMLLTRPPISEAPATAPILNGGRAESELTMLGEDTARDLVQLFKLLADETRLRIIYYLTQRGELNVRTFCQLLGQSQPAVSHHLALMRAAGVLESRRDGKHNFYRLMRQRCHQYLEVMFGAGGADSSVATGA
jgi:ArsR family transcriptional regulator, arsenate/arsenite/antimonite-responsive transcriptional repressor